jgi:hypothetical protein
MTVASASTCDASGGSTLSKAMRRRCSPAESVREAKVSLRVTAGLSHGRHHGTQVPNVKSSRPGGVNCAGVERTFQVTGVSGSAPPAK